MVTLKGKRLTKADKELIPLFVDFVLGLFCTKKKRKDAKITIRFVYPKDVAKKERADLNKYKAWMLQSKFNKNRFTITVNARMLHKTDNIFRRLKPALLCIGHELIHVKQYLTGEMRDYPNDDVWYKGQRYKEWEEGANYWFSPWELESYAYEEGLFAVFKQIILNNSSIV